MQTTVKITTNTQKVPSDWVCKVVTDVMEIKLEAYRRGYRDGMEDNRKEKNHVRR